jgi:hypothetical protein
MYIQVLRPLRERILLGHSHARVIHGCHATHHGLAIALATVLAMALAAILAVATVLTYGHYSIKTRGKKLH